LGEVLDARYQVQIEAGEGGMSYVYLAREVATGHDVAIKVLSPSSPRTELGWSGCARGRAGHATRPSECLPHPPASVNPRGLIYLVMPFLKGEAALDREVEGRPD